MRLPSAGGAGGGAHCYTYVGARRFVKENVTLFLRRKNDEDETRHPSTGGAGGGASCCGGSGGGASNIPYSKYVYDVRPCTCTAGHYRAAVSPTGTCGSPSKRCCKPVRQRRSRSMYTVMLVYLVMNVPIRWRTRGSSVTLTGHAISRTSLPARVSARWC